MNTTIDVRHAGGSYPVVISSGVLSTLGTLAEQWLPGRRLVVITDRTVARVVPHPLKVPVLMVAPGEKSKTRRRWADLTDQLLGLGFGRDTAVVAIGGGVVGDLAGFVAATFLRGVPVLQVPTSLLAMVDASVGGKTGVNTSRGKNLVGAFHPPAGVVIDPLAIRTLHPDHVRGGLIEALKHGLVADPDYFDWIGTETPKLLAATPDTVAELVRRSVEIKARVVAADERESGVRAVLNAGHTVGHALEHHSGYQLSHGDGVGLGLVVESALAEQLGLAPAGLALLVAGRLAALGLILAFPPADQDEALLQAMQQDKKVRGGRLRLSLPRAEGALASEASEWTSEATPDDVRQALGRARDIARTTVSTLAAPKPTP